MDTYLIVGIVLGAVVIAAVLMWTFSQRTAVASPPPTNPIPHGTPPTDPPVPPVVRR